MKAGSGTQLQDTLNLVKNVRMKSVSKYLVFESTAVKFKTVST